jgi:hypothetical protein
LSRIGLPKRLEAYWFIEIKDANEFRVQLLQLVPLITSSTQAKKDETACFDHRGKDDDLTLAGVNISFSRKGLNKVRHPFRFEHHLHLKLEVNLMEVS